MSGGGAVGLGKWMGSNFWYVWMMPPRRSRVLMEESPVRGLAPLGDEEPPGPTTVVQVEQDVHQRHRDIVPVSLVVPESLGIAQRDHRQTIDFVVRAEGRL